MIYPKIFFYVFLLNICQSFCDIEDNMPKKYHNYTLFRGIPVTTEHMSFFQNLSNMYDVKFWRKPGLMSKPVDVMIKPADQPAFMENVLKYGLYITTIIKDVQEAFDQQAIKTYIRRRTESFDWQSYFSIDDIYEWINDLAQIYPNRMSVTKIGRTFENRDILAVRVNLNDEASKQHCNKTLRTKVFVEGGIHAREWVSPAFVTYMINELVHAPSSTDSALRTVAYNHEWHFIPILNPDGYEYTHSKDRMWRKNRRHGFYGVDINRNFGLAFGKVGISFDNKSEIYCGPGPFSESESKALANYLRSNCKNIEYYLGFHSYGQYIIIPYAHTTSHEANYDEMKLIGENAARAIRSRYGTTYTVGTAYDTVGYTTSGISSDWAKRAFDIPYVATFELRDSGAFGFALPSSKILPTCMETMDGMVTLLTPRSAGWSEQMKKKLKSKGRAKTLDYIVVVFNAFLFIIVCLD